MKIMGKESEDKKEEKLRGVCVVKTDDLNKARGNSVAAPVINNSRFNCERPIAELCRRRRCCRCCNSYC